MHLLGPIAVVFLLVVGLLVLETRLGRGVRDEDRLLLAPAIGLIVVGAIGLTAGICGAVGAIRWIAVLLAVTGVWRWRVIWQRVRATDLLTKFVIVAFLLSLLAEFTLVRVFQHGGSGPDRVWTTFNATGVSPPDQMFAWRQAAYYQHGLRYGRDSFYEDMDLFDRPHLGGAVTLFFAECMGHRLPNVRLPEGSFEIYEYPRAMLRFYQSLWRSLNTLYLFGVAMLVRRLLGFRMAVLAVGLSALSAHFVLSSAGIWVKFAPLYLLLLMAALLIERRGPWLAGVLGAASFHLHGSMLPFLLGAGAFLVARWMFAARAERAPALRNAVAFAACGIVFIGPWFVIPRALGSRQPLMMYYLYDAGLTEAQHADKEQLKATFHGRTSLSGLVALPVYNVLRSLTPYRVLEHIGGYSYQNPPHASLQNISTAIMHSEMNCLPAAVGIWAVPVVYVGLVQMLRLRRWDVLLLFAYLIPTVFIALLYRKDRMIMTPVISPYHAIAVLAACVVLRRVSTAGCVALCVFAVADNAFVSLFAWERFHPLTRGLEWDHLWNVAGVAAVGYVLLLLATVVLTGITLRTATASETSAAEVGCLGFDVDCRTLFGIPPLVWKVCVVLFSAVGILCVYSMVIVSSFR